MRILHTADWHLGQNLMFHDRKEEHEQALKWVLEQMVEHKVDAIIVAGDIFDITSPPNYARRMYYDFLKRLLATPCRHVLILGGNHDSPAMLEASGGLLEAFKISVIGAAPETPDQAILEWRDPEGRLEAVVAAVPFLRDRDIKAGIAGESMEERHQRIEVGILKYYQSMADLTGDYSEENVPLITTGHLYAKGAVTTEEQDKIFIGNLENIDAATFPKKFHYVGLGHIHRPQAVGGKEHIRYSGSLIPLSFSETKDEKGVLLLDFKGAELTEIRFLASPVFRRLKSIRGDAESVRERLREYNKREHGSLPSWVEVVLTDDQAPPGYHESLREFVKEEGLDLVLVKIILERSAKGNVSWEEESADLLSLSELEVFHQRCKEAGCSEEETVELTETFLELRTWMTETEE